MIDNNKEYILCSAILRIKERSCPKIYRGKFNDIYKIEIGWRHPDIFTRFKGEVSTNPDDQGFYTSRGRFVRREEGLFIAKNSGQINATEGGILLSEDLY